MKLAALAVLLLPWNVAAHPLGQESVDRFARLEITPGKVIVVYDLNMAERATARELPFLDANHDGTYDDVEQRTYTADLARRVAADLLLEVDGAPLVLVPIAPRIYLTAGEGNLPTLRLITTLETIPTNPGGFRQGGGSHLASFHDKNALSLAGWRQISVDGLGMSISQQTVNGNPATTSAQGYLTDVQGEQTAARWTSFRFALSTGNTPPPPPPSTTTSSTGLERRIVASSRKLTLALVGLGGLTVGLLALWSAKRRDR